MNYPPTQISRIIRSQRKSFGLEITPDGQLIVRAPKSASDAQIQAVIAQKAAWIAKARARLAAQYPDLTPKTFSPSETFWYLGEQYPLRLVDRQRPLLDLDGAFHLARHAHSQAKQVFITWYREETRHITQELIADYAKRFNLKVNGVRITSARTRWGSCSGRATSTSPTACAWRLWRSSNMWSSTSWPTSRSPITAAPSGLRLPICTQAIKNSAPGSNSTAIVSTWIETQSLTA
jgi:predicted metal-dependent hydrolase